MAEAAARLHDPIEHTRALTGLIAGAIIGGAVATVAVVFAPVTVPVLIGGAIIAGSTVGVAALGETLGSLSWAKTIEGEIAPTCSSNVFINGLPAARAHVDFVDCRRHPAHPPVAQGSSSVFINGQPAARKGDRAGCDAVIAGGSPNVFIGGDTITTDEISPEVPEFVHTTMLVVGVASAVILVGPAAAALGLLGSIVGGSTMNYVGGELFGEGSDGQKLMAFGGGLVGGLGAAKVGTGAFRTMPTQGLGPVGARPPSSRMSMVADEQPAQKPAQPYNRKAHYGRTPTKADRAAVGAEKGEVADHTPPLVQRYYEGDPAIGEKPGYQMTPAERAASAQDRTRMSPQPKDESDSQGGKMAAYSRSMKRKFGL